MGPVYFHLDILLRDLDVLEPLQLDTSFVFC